MGSEMSGGESALMYRKGLEPKPSRGCATPSPALMRQMLTTFITALMAEADAVCGAEYGIRSEERTDSRNGYRERPSTPGPGRWMSPFRSCVRAPTYLRWLLQRWRRAEAAPTTVAATSYLLGVSARRMEKLVETLGITRLSNCLLYTSPSPRDKRQSRMPSSA